MPAGYKSGQILVLVLLIVVVALSVGLSVASRNITNLRTSTQTEQSQRAFSAAEGGVEDVLSRLNTIKDDIAAGQSTVKTVPVGDISATVTVTAANTYTSGSPVKPGEVAQITLDTPSGPDPASVQIEWAKKGTEEERDTASLYVNIIYQSGANYADYRLLYSGGWAGGNISDEVGTFDPTICTSTEYSKCATISFTPIGVSSPIYMRIRPYWGPTSLKVSGANIPIQNYEISSTASTESGVTREVKVVRNAFPVLPAAFDYVLYSDGWYSKIIENI